MVKQVTKSFVPLVAILWFLAGSDLNGQQQAQNNQKLKEASLADFEQGKYRSALSGFRSLLEIDGDNPQYSYYAGRCLVELKDELDEAIELLYRASSSGAQADAMLYLGRAYHLNYNFQAARTCYERYERTASKQERKTHRVKHLIASCKSASEITEFYNPYEVMNVTFMDLTDSIQYTQVKMKGGNLGQKTQAYFYGGEDREGLTALMFHPTNPVRGDYAYFSGYGKNRKEGAQIFRVRKGTGKSWSDPQEVSSLNTQGDEILPYFDPIENDLYFASDGKYGVGGFDLYKSHYDAERDQWTDPVNLGFPVNSAADEYLLLPGSDLGMVLFFSNRQGPDSLLTVYRVHLVEPKERTASKDDHFLNEIAQLGGVAEEMLAQSDAIQHKKGQDEIVPIEAAYTKQVNKTTVPSVSESPDDVPYPVYQETLALALKHQAVSDSLKDLAANARTRVRESDDPNDRWVWQKQIMVWEKKANDEEEKADQLYAQMELERSKQSFGTSVNLPETIEVDRQIGDLTVYRYRQSPNVQAVEQRAPGTSTPIRQFDILRQSPYGVANPIPMDVSIPKGTFYRIQLGAFGMKVSPHTFGGISPVTGESFEERGLVKYYAGKFSRYEDASTALARIHSLGYEDAFIVAWYNGVQVSTQRAKQLE
jgi:tetratricopeptide (TPR) repeat protein